MSGAEEKVPTGGELTLFEAVGPAGRGIGAKRHAPPLAARGVEQPVAVAVLGLGEREAQHLAGGVRAAALDGRAGVPGLGRVDPDQPHPLVAAVGQSHADRVSVGH